MKSNLKSGLLLLYFVPLLVACTTENTEPAAAVVDKEQIKKEIQAKENEFAEIYNTGELKDIGYFADDAITFAPNRAPIIGRQAIVEYLKVDIETNTDKISFTTKEVFVSNDGEMVVEIAEIPALFSGKPNHQFTPPSKIFIAVKPNIAEVFGKSLVVSDHPDVLKISRFH